MEVGHRLVAVLAADVGRDVGHRSGPEERDHGGDVAQLGRTQVLHVAAHPRALELEDAGRLPGREELERLRVVQRQAVDVDLDPAVAADELDRVGQDGEVDEPQEVELQEAQRLAGVHLELGHGRLAVRGPLEGHDVGQRIATDDDPGGVGRGVASDPLQLPSGPDQAVHPFITGHQLPELGARLDRALQADVQLVGNGLGHPVCFGIGEAHGPRRVADGRLGAQRAEGDDLRHTIRAVLVGDVLDDLAPAAVLEVDVDVRQGHPVGVQEALERQPVGQRVDRRDAQRVGHDAARRRSPAGGEDPLLAREPGEVGHDQEVARVPHPIDRPQLVVESAPDLGRDVGIARRQAALALAPQPGDRRLAIGHGVVRQAQSVELELQIDHLGNPQGVVHRVGQLAVEQAAHLVW